MITDPAFYAVAIGLTQRHPKAVLAYSSVSQMGVVAAVLGWKPAPGDPPAGQSPRAYFDALRAAGRDAGSRAPARPA